MPTPTLTVPDHAALVPRVEAPRTRDEILAALERLHGESAAYWNAFDTDAFFRPFGTAWSPADNVRHLTKSIRAVTQGLRLPRLALGLMFGRAGRASRDYDQVVERYHGVLAAGGKAGRFAPSQRQHESDADAWRAEVMLHHDLAAEGLAAAARGWSEAALDRYRLPHPLLGKLTVREMLHFTLYHNLHHVLGVERRRVGDGAHAT